MPQTVEGSSFDFETPWFLIRLSLSLLIGFLGFVSRFCFMQPICSVLFYFNISVYNSLVYEMQLPS